MKALILLTIVAIVNAVELKFYDTAECSGEPTGSAVYQVSETVSFENYKKLNQTTTNHFLPFLFSVSQTSSYYQKQNRPMSVNARKIQ